MEIHALIAYYRKLHMHTLKSLAQAMDLSERTVSQVEKGQIPSPYTLEKIQSVVPYQTWDATEENEIQSLLAQCFQSILYVDYTRAKNLVDALTEKALDYSKYTVSWTLYRYMYVIHTQDARFDLDDLDHQLALLKPYMSPVEQDIYFIEQAGYYFLKGDLKKSFAHAKRSLNEVQDAHLRAINLFILGASGINEIGRIEEATTYLEEAETIFLEFANYERARRCQAFQLIGMVHGHRYDEVLPQYQALKQTPSRTSNPIHLDAFIDGTLARYYTFIEEYDTALEVLKKISFKSSANYYLMLYCYYQTHQWDALSKHLKAMDSWQEPINNVVHLSCIKTIKTYLQDGDIHGLAERLEATFKLALKTQDYLSIMLVSKSTIDALKKAKRYKDAYRLAGQKLSILRENT